MITQGNFGPGAFLGLGHGSLGHKIPVELLEAGTEAVAIDERIAPLSPTSW